MSSKKYLKNENYLGFFLLIIALMLFATVVKSCNIAGYKAQQERDSKQSQAQTSIENSEVHGINTQR
jgi:high-affinity Fe2+/Pb2+ permease